MLDLDTQPHDEETTIDDDNVTAADSFVLLRDGSIVRLDDEHQRVALVEDATALRRGQEVTVDGERGEITGFSNDREHAYVCFGTHARKVDVDEVVVAMRDTSDGRFPG